MTNLNINPNHMFSGELAFLSNMYPCKVRMKIGGKEYVFDSSEAAFQAGKSENPKEITLFTRVKDGKDAKRLGRKITLREDWDNYRLLWMKRVVYSKFIQNPELMEKLIDTYPLTLKETNYWHDTFWGICNGKGENHLGKILMEIRETKLPYEKKTGDLNLMTF